MLNVGHTATAAALLDSQRIKQTASKSELTLNYPNFRNGAQTRNFIAKRDPYQDTFHK